MKVYSHAGIFVTKEVFYKSQGTKILFLPYKDTYYLTA